MSWLVIFGSLPAMMLWIFVIFRTAMPDKMIYAGLVTCCALPMIGVALAVWKLIERRKILPLVIQILLAIVMEFFLFQLWSSISGSRD